MKQIRLQRPRARGVPPWDGVLPLDPRDPDVVRAKALARGSGAGDAPGQRRHHRPEGGR